MSKYDIDDCDFWAVLCTFKNITHKYLQYNKRTHKRTRAFDILHKRTESDKIVIGGMDNENDTKKRNAYN